MPELTQVESGNPAVEHPIGVVYFAMADEVDEVCRHGLQCTFAAAGIFARTKLAG